jgi:hypothetical protein
MLSIPPVDFYANLEVTCYLAPVPQCRRMPLNGPFPDFGAAIISTTLLCSAPNPIMLYTIINIIKIRIRKRLKFKFCSQNNL